MSVKSYNGHLLQSGFLVLSLRPSPSLSEMLVTSGKVENMISSRAVMTVAPVGVYSIFSRELFCASNVRFKMRLCSNEDVKFDRIGLLGHNVLLGGNALSVYYNNNA